MKLKDRMEENSEKYTYMVDEYGDKVIDIIDSHKFENLDSDYVEQIIEEIIKIQATKTHTRREAWKKIGMIDTAMAGLVNKNATIATT